MGALFRVLLLIGFVMKFWWVIAAVLVVALAGAALWLCTTRHAAELERRRRAQAAIAARADEQHAQVLARDERGIYGKYVPTQIA
jgi:hypothetical protein